MEAFSAFIWEYGRLCVIIARVKFIWVVEDNSVFESTMHLHSVWRMAFSFFFSILMKHSWREMSNVLMLRHHRTTIFCQYNLFSLYFTLSIGVADPCAICNTYDVDVSECKQSYDLHHFSSHCFSDGFPFRCNNVRLIDSDMANPYANTCSDILSSNKIRRICFPFVWVVGAEYMYESMPGTNANENEREPKRILW